MVIDINNLRSKPPGLRPPDGQITHVDSQNGVVALKRYKSEGDVLLMVINSGAGHWNSNHYHAGSKFTI